jgi:hypothetical protein
MWEKPLYEVPWTVVLVDVSSGQQRTAAAVSRLVSERLGRPEGECGLDEMWWLPGNTLLMQVTEGSKEIYTYKPDDDTFTPLASGKMVEAVAPEGSILLADEDGGAPSVWQNGASQPVLLQQGWSYGFGAAFTADGRSLVLRVQKTGSEVSQQSAGGWQLFTQQGSEWHPAGEVQGFDSAGQTVDLHPWVVAGDGRTAWAEVQVSTETGGTSYLRSLDLVSGAWRDWLHAADQKDPLEPIVFKDLVP